VMDSRLVWFNPHAFVFGPRVVDVVRRCFQ
jgi:hypothetical protein